VPIGTGTTLFVPAGVQHGFGNSGTSVLRVVVVFPGGSFADTTLLESDASLAETQDLA